MAPPDDSAEPIPRRPDPGRPETRLAPLSEFFLPQDDFPAPSALDASITVEVLDPAEGDQRVRIVETIDPFAVQVKWCLWGALVGSLVGCWNVSVYIDDIDGVGPTHGLLGSARVAVESQPVVQADDMSQRCYEYRFNLPAGSVGAGIYNLVVVVTLASGSCETPGPLLHDVLGYAAIPVLVFFQD
jgi:hypothetical protein